MNELQLNFAELKKFINKCVKKGKIFEDAEEVILISNVCNNISIIAGNLEDQLNEAKKQIEFLKQQPEEQKNK